MSQLAMPLLVVNLGCEMVYILEQRLKAQNIPADKSCKVLNDVIGTMFASGYVEKLFAPQETCTVLKTRKIFDRLAHSSIMRLSESSMDKLFDLMMMGFKYQLLCSTKLEQMLEITLLHLTSIRSIVESLPDRSAGPLITAVEGLVTRTYSGLGVGALHLLRQSLMRFFQDKRVKVSLFLQEGIQTSMGRIVLPTPDTAYVGTVTTYDMAGGLESQEELKTKSGAVDRQEFFVHPAPLGTNLYNKERARVVPPPRKGDLLTGPIKPEEDYKTMRDEYGERGGFSTKEFAYLSALLNVKPPPADNFKLQLFGDDDAGTGTGAEPHQRATSLAFVGSGRNDKHLAAVMAEMKVDDGGKGTETDLLDLMDGA